MARVSLIAFPRSLAAVLAGLLLSAGAAPAQAGESGEPYAATTTQSPELPLDELALLVKPLTAEELELEADAWLALLRAKTLEVSQAEIAIKQKNRTIEKAEAVQEAIEGNRELLEEVQEAAEEAGEQGSVEAAEKVSELAQAASEMAAEATETIDEVIETVAEVAENEHVQEALDQTAASNAARLGARAEEAERATAAVSRSADETLAAADSGRKEEAERLAEETVGAVGEAQQALLETSDAVAEALEAADGEQLDDSSRQLDETAEAVEALAESEMDDKIDMLDLATALREERTGRIDRLNIVLDEWASKLPPAKEGGENGALAPYRLYAASVAGIQVDISDTQAAWSSLLGWLRSDVGGVRWLRNLGVFVATVLGFWLLGRILARIIDKGMRIAGRPALMIREFIVRSVRRGCTVIGVIIGLTALQVNVGPLLAVIGAAGFVIGLALQNTLSNFASGMMIMVYRPFDVGDWIEVDGVIGVAKSMNLVTTTIATLDNQILIVPNNAIWGNTIINVTGSETRRVDLIVGISYDDDIGDAERIMHDILREHPLVLDDPEPVIAVQELAEYSVNFVCRPWTKTENYWRVYWDVTRSVKERFEAAGLETPYPHHNLHRRVSPGDPALQGLPA